MAKGIKTGGGSRKGIPNKVSVDLREAIHEAFVKAGGANYLLTVARDNPAVFLRLLGMTLPKNINLTGEVSLVDLLTAADRKAHEQPQLPATH
jgi:hypothetical protein